ncbi:MAG: G8 domain-containing protein, partial [Burkholderiaceae bacterium]
MPPRAAALPWSDPASWGGTLPPAGAQVLIPAGRAIVLDADTPALAGLQIDGALYFADKNVKLTAGWVMTTGLLQAGTEAEPYKYKSSITLTGTNESLDLQGFGNKFLGAMNGGRLEIHGHRRDALAFSQLDAHASPGDTAI